MCQRPCKRRGCSRVSVEVAIHHPAWLRALAAPRHGARQLLLQARRYNARFGVTGTLLYCQDSFFQVLEGAPNTLDATFARISADPRHNKIIKLIQEPIEQRNFAEWTMVLGKVDREQLGAIPGLNDFFKHSSCYWELEEGRARTLLGLFVMVGGGEQSPIDGMCP
jgi:hypothetical protein